jgi:hypothetical protein
MQFQLFCMLIQMVNKSREEVNGGDLPRPVLSQCYGLTSGAAAQVCNA